MKYFTIFLILTVLVNAKCEKDEGHCKTCDECEALCTACDSTQHYVPHGEICECDRENGYSKPSTSTDDVCVLCDPNCEKKWDTSENEGYGCKVQGKAGKCDSICVEHYSVVQSSGKDWDHTCVKCDDHCTSGCSAYAVSLAENDLPATGKCDSTCGGQYSLIKDTGKTWDHTCLECDPNCDMTGTDGGCESKGKSMTQNALTIKKCDAKCV